MNVYLFIFWFYFLTINLATIDKIKPIEPIEKKLPIVRLFSIIATIIEIIKPIKPNPAPRTINNYPILNLSLPIGNPPIITDKPPREAIKIKIANIIWTKKLLTILVVTKFLIASQVARPLKPDIKNKKIIT